MLLEFLERIVAVGEDLKFFGSTGACSLVWCGMFRSQVRKGIFFWVLFLLSRRDFRRHVVGYRLAQEGRKLWKGKRPSGYCACACREGR